MKKSEYDLIIEDDYKVFIEKVNRRLDQGWELIGGVCLAETVDRGDYDSRYVQAVIKRVS